jgi:hypothetical protein
VFAEARPFGGHAAFRGFGELLRDDGIDGLSGAAVVHSDERLDRNPFTDE